MEFEREFEYAQKIIKEAGNRLLSAYNNNNKILLKADFSWVTEIDQETENFIRDHLTSEFPDYGFIGEEGSELEREIAWIVDPLDGTIAFSKHIPEFGIAIAFKKDTEVIFSVQYIPLQDALLTAYKNHGAFCNGDKLKIDNEKKSQQILLSINGRNLWQEHFQDYLVRLTDKQFFRAGHSSVVESYYLASGRTDVYVRLEQPIWDVAAEYLLMKEAGATITDMDNKPLELHFSKSARHNMIATNSFLNNTLPVLYK